LDSGAANNTSRGFKWICNATTQITITFVHGVAAFLEEGRRSPPVAGS
jgi:hypothetical protein